MRTTRTDHPAENPAAPPPPLSLQSRMVILSYLAYFFYYFTRKHLSVATGPLVEQGFSLETIGYVNSAYAVCYAIGQFLSGALGDRSGPRIALCAGMCLSGIATLAFGLFPFVAVLAIGFTANGLFQATGWPASCKLITLWVSDARRGRVMGFWLSCYILGSLAATAFSGFILKEYGWKEIFLVNGVVVTVIGIIQGLFLINRPEDRGYSFETSTAKSETASGERHGFLAMLVNPSVLLLGLSYFGLKYTRYTLFAWLPFYLEKVVGLTRDAPAYVSNGFEAGGVVGLILGGFFADRFFPRNRCRLALLALLGMIVVVYIYRLASTGLEITGNVAGLAAIGFFLYIADSIISGTAAQDLGGTASTASACGIINGIGSLGQILAGIVPVKLAEWYGWNSVFISFIVFGLISCLAVLPVALRKKLVET
ncbi:MFS transporter [Luteolibacter soli]|uniref:MFS transporter n=1 Tax=Luteolibacter soli TaxID=3135280 RepID=A0ABU9AUP7_9BACT